MRPSVGSLLALLALVLTACQAMPPSAVPRAPERTDLPAHATLEINGMNYTDGYMASFEVNNVGGSNLEVSIPTAGGGKATCCVNIFPRQPLPWTYPIKWTRDRKRWCIKQVSFNGPIPAKPEHFVVHFMPDGQIELELTETYPDPKLKLERFHRLTRKPTGNQFFDEQVADRCQDGYITYR